MRYLATLITGLVLPLSSLADTRFEYTGLPVTSFAAPFVSGDRVTAFFEIAGNARSGNFSSESFTNFGASIGGLQLSRATGAEAGATLTFDGTGTLTSWSFVVGLYSGAGGDPSLIEVWLNSADLAPAGDRITAYVQGSSILGATAQPGVWAQVAVVPEPHQFIIFATGLLVVLSAGRLRSGG